MGESRGIHNLWAAQVCSRLGVPLVWSAYGGLAVGAGIRKAYRAGYDIVFTRRVVPRVTRFVAQTPHEATVYERHGAHPERIREIPLCVDLNDFQLLPGPGTFRRRIGLTSEAYLVVCVARLSPVKGLDLLIEAFSRIEESPCGPHLALVGWDHGSGSTLKAQARRLGVDSRVHFSGPLYGDERLTAYVDADVFALSPRVYEETSLAALEAAACGRPTVLTAQCEIPGLAAAGGGLLVDRSAEAIAAELGSLLADDVRRREMGALARNHVQKHFSASAVAAQHEAVFRELIA
jgi:glycosyltransferase involved in cell wall biosynthesis